MSLALALSGIVNVPSKFCACNHCWKAVCSEKDQSDLIIEPTKKPLPVINKTKLIPFMATNTLRLGSLLLRDNATAYSVSLSAPALTATSAYVFPSAKPSGTNGILQSDTSGNFTWNTSSGTSKVKLYSAGYYNVAYVAVPLQLPTLSLTMANTGDNTFSADVTLLSVDPISNEKIATLRFTAVGGKKSGASGTNIVVGNVQSTGTADAQFSTVVTATATKITMTKDTGTVNVGNYSCMVHVSILNGSVTNLIDENGAGLGAPSTLITFGY